MKYFQKYKNYLIAAGILIVGILIGNLFSSGDSETTKKVNMNMFKMQRHNYGHARCTPRSRWKNLGTVLFVVWN